VAPAIVFYISGHGFGHASRCIEVINAVLATRPETRIGGPSQRLAARGTDAAGGLGDVRVRTAIPYLRKYLPGNPHIISIYVPSAGGIQAGNMMAKTLKNDGLTIANIGTSIFTRAASKDPTVQYRLSDFTYLGAPSVGGPYALLVHRLGIDSLAKLKAHNKLRFAERSVGHTMYNVGRIMAFVLELKDPQWVVGYESPEVDIAVQRGEGPQDRHAEQGEVPCRAERARRRKRFRL